jgi:hypothetical protein
MTMLTAQVAMAIALQCLPPPLAPIAVGIAKHESGLDPLAKHHNTNGTTDWGLGQVNSSNFAWLSKSMGTPVNERTILDPCLNLRASMRVLFVRYNGSPPDSVASLYAAQVMTQMASTHDAPAPPPSPSGSSPFSKPARTGRDLVFAPPSTGLDKQ